MNKKISFALLSIIFIMVTSSIVFAYQDVYNVEEGDTLWKISRKYQVPLSDVIEVNTQFEDPDLIYPNDSVYIPFETNGKIGASMIDSGDGTVNTNAAKVNKNAALRAAESANSFEQQVAQLVNRERASRGLTQLKISEELSNIARIKSEDMRDKKYFDHTSPNFGSPFTMLKEFGVKYKTAGENIAKGQKSPEAVMKAWMNSEGHRRNILNPDYRELGVGFVKDNYGTTYWTQQFISR